jgi:predicted hydrolase (HD superfamily)
MIDGNLTVHTHETAEILDRLGVDPEIIDAIKMHNEDAWGMKRNTVLHHALAAGETITGLIAATALVYPDKKLASVKAKSVTKRMKEKAFAASVNRDTIMECEKLGIPFDEFAEICLGAMKEISDRLGL